MFESYEATIEKILHLCESFTEIVVNAAITFIYALVEHHIRIVENYLYENNLSQILITILENNKSKYKKLQVRLHWSF